MALVAVMIMPHSVFGGIRYSMPFFEIHDADHGSGQRERQVERIVDPIDDGGMSVLVQGAGTVTETLSGGRVYRTQYDPYTPPPSPYTLPTSPLGSGQTNQTGAAAPGGQVRQSLPTVVPFITVSERYDSNVNFSATQKKHDYVTNVSPGVRWNYQSSYVDGSATGGMTVAQYVLNPGLSYISTSGGLTAGLGNLFGRMVPGWSVHIVDSFAYTPQTPAFMAPEAGNQLPDSFIRGIQAYRSNSFSNAGSIMSAVPLTADTTVITNYSNNIIRFLGTPVQNRGGGLLNTTSHSISVGPQYHLSPIHSISATYQYQDVTSIPQGGGAGGRSFTTHGGMLSWQGHLTPLVSVELGGGGSVISPANSFQKTARASMQYNTPTVQGSLSYSRRISPSYFLAGGAYISDLVTASLTYFITEKWFIVGAFNYSMNSLTSGPSVRFESYGPTGSVNYRISPYIVASGTVTQYQMNSVSSGTSFTVERETIMLSIRAEWN